MPALTTITYQNFIGIDYFYSWREICTGLYQEGIIFTNGGNEFFINFYFKLFSVINFKIKLSSSEFIRNKLEF